MSEDWLDIGEKAGLPVPVTLPDDYKSRLALVEKCWRQLSEGQRTFLHAWRDCRFNARAAARQLGGGRTSHVQWMHEPEYATVVRVWRANAAADALDRDKVIARHEDIIEEAMTPKPILHQGVPTGFEEIELSVAARANEALLDRVLPKPREGIEVNVGVYAPVQVEVEKPAGTVLDATVDAVEADPLLPVEEDWLT